jgi:uncharacterized integral membrane protein
VKALGWVAGLFFSVALVMPGLAALCWVALHHFLYWEIIKGLGRDFPGWAFWWALLVLLIIKIWLPYKIADTVGMRLADWEATRPLIWLGTYSLISGAVFVYFVYWQQSLDNSETFNLTFWINPILYYAWVGPSAIFWIRLSEQEATRKEPPRWVGKADEFNARYRLWCGFMKPALGMGPELFAWEKIKLPDTSFGAAHEASVSEIDKAGLL